MSKAAVRQFLKMRLDAQRKAWDAEDKKRSAERALEEYLEEHGLRERKWSCMSRSNPGNHITPKEDGSKCIFCGLACWDNELF